MKKKKSQVILPFQTDEFREMWQIWIQYKKEQHGFKYKSAISEQMALKKLAKLSDQDEQKAILIIEESISNGWKGHFKLKSNEQRTTEGGPTTVSQSYVDRLREQLQS